MVLGILKISYKSYSINLKSLFLFIIINKSFKKSVLIKLLLFIITVKQTSISLIK